VKRKIKFKRIFQHDQTGRIFMTTWGNLDHNDKDCDDFSSFKSPSQVSGSYPIIDLQFTGLTDKNGKEIYEGDVIKTETEKAMVVSWNNHFASFCLDRAGWMFTHYFGEGVDPEQIEIIGNIYENPKLLSNPA